MNKVLTNKRAIVLFLLPATMLCLLVIVAPIAMSTGYSLTEWDGIGDKAFVGLNNYRELFVVNRDGFWKAVANSLIFAAGSVGIQLPISLAFALLLARGVRGEGFYVSVYFIPVLISTVVIGQLWMKIYNPQYGLLNVFLKSVGLSGLANNWLGNTSTVVAAVIVPILWQYIGYHMLLMYSFIKSIPEDIFEAAKMDGANALQTAFQITIPLMKPIIKVCMTFAVVGSLKNFDLVYVMTNGGPGGASQLPSTLMVETIFSRNMYGYGSSMAMFIIIECFLFAFIIRRAFRERKEGEGV